MPCYADGKLVNGNGSCACDFSDGGEATGASRTLGNTDNYDLGFLTNGLQRFFLDRGGAVGIGTVVPDTKAILDVVSTSRGVLIPRMTTAQRMAIVAPSNGLMVFDTDLEALTRYDALSSSWYIRRNVQRCGAGLVSNPATYNGVACTGVSTFTLNNFWRGSGYSGTNDNAAICITHLPNRYVPATDIEIELHWAISPTAGNTVWGVGIVAASQNEYLGGNAAANYKTVISPAAGTSFYKQVATVTYSGADVTGFLPLDAVATVIYRHATNPSDNIASTAIMTQYILKYWSRD